RPEPLLPWSERRRRGRRRPRRRPPPPCWGVETRACGAPDRGCRPTRRARAPAPPSSRCVSFVFLLRVHLRPGRRVAGGTCPLVSRRGRSSAPSGCPIGVGGAGDAERTLDSE